MATPERESVEMVRLKNKGFTDRLRTEVFLFAERPGGVGRKVRPTGGGGITNEWQGEADETVT